MRPEQDRPRARAVIRPSRTDGRGPRALRDRVVGAAFGTTGRRRLLHWQGALVGALPNAFTRSFLCDSNQRQTALLR